MRKLSILFVTLMLTQAAHADIIRCIFTEPFWDFEYSTTTNELKLTKSGMTEDGSDIVEVTKSGSF